MTLTKEEKAFRKSLAVLSEDERGAIRVAHDTVVRRICADYQEIIDDMQTDFEDIMNQYEILYKRLRGIDAAL